MRQRERKRERRRNRSTRTLGTVGNKKQPTVCSSCSIKISSQGETAEKCFSQQRPSGGEAKSRWEQDNLHNNVLLLIWNPMVGIPVEKTPHFLVLPIREGALPFRLWEQRMGKSLFNITLPCEINETLMFAILVAGLLFFQL